MEKIVKKHEIEAQQSTELQILKNLIQFFLVFNLVLSFSYEWFYFELVHLLLPGIFTGILLLLIFSFFSLYFSSQIFY